MWSQAIQNHISLLDLTQYRWKIVEGKLECDWESAENQAAVRKLAGLLFRGCSCSSVLHAAPNVVVLQVKRLNVVLGAGVKTAPIQSIQQLVQHLHLNSVLMIF